MVGIIVLLVPIVLLGMPSTGSEGGGYLAKLRQEHELGETTLGDVDPTSAAMNLVLLGLRGPAVTILWVQADHQKETKQWAQMRATTESITKLQPHFLNVWRFQGWNLAFNVSSQWDDVADRYFWVKEGAKFTMRGSKRNTRYPELYWEVGRIVGSKVGRADEWQHFRQFFINKDPDEQTWGGGPDRILNPRGKGFDNYLVAREWFLKANEADNTHRQHMFADVIFRSYPARAYFEYAGVLGREGRFDERRRIAWENALGTWTNEFGQEMFAATHGPPLEIQLEADEEVIQRLVRENNAERPEGIPEITAANVREWIDRYQKMCNYRDWRTRGESESDEQTLLAHRELFEGEQYYWDAEFEKSRDLLYQGLTRYEQVLKKHPALLVDEDTIEESVRAVLIWQKVLNLLGEPVPEQFPLSNLYKEQASLAAQLDNPVTLKRRRLVYEKDPTVRD